MVFKDLFQKSVKGFTLVELMVSLFIMSVATGLLLENYPESSIRLTLLNNTHISALLVREAQMRGSAVDSSNSQIGGYGVFIDSATSSQAILFADSIDGVSIKNQAGFNIGDGIYNTSVSPDTVKSTLLFKEGYFFKKLCIASSTASTAHGFLCDGDNTPPISSLTISFNRPSQIAHIYINGSTLIDYPGACIQLYSPKSPGAGHIRSIQMYHSGIVTTEMTPCD